MAHEVAPRMSAGVLLGAPLAFALCGLYGYLGPGTLQDKYVVVLFLVLPVWIALIGLALAARSPWHAWLGLALGNGLAFALLGAARQFTS